MGLVSHHHQHVLDPPGVVENAARQAVGFSQGRARSDLEYDQLLARGLVRLLEVVGEAASGISDATKRVHPQVPWPEIIATRNRLIHGYFDVDLDIVWSIVTQDLPALVRELEAILELSST
jgi:uncharacterized protein with HEPN domain